MARIVTITQPADTVRCSPDGRADYMFTIHNISGSSLRVGAQLQVDEPAKESWLTIQGPSERELGENASEQITVKAQIPPNISPGKYKFRLLVYSVKRPGEDYTEGETVAIEVPAKEEPPPPPPPNGTFPWWIAAVIVVLLIGGGAAWYFWPSTVQVPDVVGKPLTEAKTTLEGANLTIAERIVYQETREQPPNNVIEQIPEAGSEVGKGTAIHLTVAEKATVEVPRLIDMRLATALQKLSSKGLSLGDVNEKADKDKPVGTVLDQTPSPDSRVEEGTMVSLTVSREPGKTLVLDSDQIKIIEEMQTTHQLKVPMKLLRQVPEATPEAEQPSDQ